MLIDGVALSSMSDETRTDYRARRMGFVLQFYNLMPVLTAVENVELPLLVARVPAKPIVVVPPDAPSAPCLRRVLVPVEAGVSPTLTPRAIIELARGTDLDVVVLHVHEETSLRAFTDQPQHEQPAWAREFLRRYCPWGIGTVRLEVRVGRSDELVPAVAEQTGADLIALGWAQQLVPGRAHVVRATLERARTPVMLVPVEVASPFAASGTVSRS